LDAALKNGYAAPTLAARSCWLLTMPVDAPTPHQPLVYVSYAWGDDSVAGREREAIVDDLCSALHQDGFEVGRDKRRQEIGDSIEKFAADISRADLVLLVVSQKYLKSYHCMVEELFQIYRRCFENREEFQQRTCLLLLDDARDDIGVSEELITHWQTVVQSQEHQLERLDPERTSSPHAWQALKRKREMIRCLPDILSALRDPVMPRGTLAISNDAFSAIRQLVRKRLENYAHWRRQRSSIIPEEQELQVDGGRSAPAQGSPSVHFLALVLSRGKQLVAKLDWNSPVPWEFHAYQWNAYEYDLMTSNYKVVDGLGYHLRPTVVASKDASGSDSMVEASTFRDLLSAAVEWQGEVPNREKTVLIELFVPVELLLFDWSSLLLPCDEDDVYGQESSLLEARPYVLRSIERFKQNRQLLQLKYAHLSDGKGRWVSGDSAEKVGNSMACKVQETVNLVAIKRLTPPEGEPRLQGAWCRGVVNTMAPLALWLRQADDCHDESACHQYLDDHYSDRLSGHGDKDPVNPLCQHFEELPKLRRASISEPLSKHLVLLVDHPDRQPLSPSASQQAPLSHSSQQ